ncbi:MAG: metallophosphoesterase family protein [Chloroflexota bacterium]
MAVKLLHTADVHLDAPFRWLGNKGRKQRAQLKDTFRTIVDLALSERVDAFLIAGDLFDSNQPMQDTVDFVRGQLSRLSAPVFILPGTHDCLDASSIYRRANFGNGGPGVHLFDDSHTAFALSGLDITVHARANLTKTSPASPLRGLTPNAATRHNVALAHGSLPIPGGEDDFPITPQELANSGMDYVALGHWHALRDYTTGGVPAYYPGPPELLTTEEDQGSVVLVELNGSDRRVTPRQVGRRRFAEVCLPLDGVDDGATLFERVRSRADPELALRVRLTGLRQLALVFEAAGLEQELADRFFALRIDDESHPQLATEDIEAFPDALVIGQFARRMRARIEAAADDGEKRRSEAALQLGLALLAGKRVLG